MDRQGFQTNSGQTNAPDLAPNSPRNAQESGESGTPSVSALRAEIIAIGDELSSGVRLDTNSQWISQRLDQLLVALT